MRKFPAAAAALMIVTALALAGCSTWFESSAKPANDAIATANVHMKKAMTVGTTVTEAAGQLDAVPYTTAGAAAALKLTGEIRAALASQKSELEAAKAAMDSIATLDVADELKAYAKLEATAIGTRVRVVDLGAKLYTEMEKLYSALNKGKTRVPDTEKTLANIETIKRDITAVSELAAQQAKAASDYFTAEKLGR